MVNVNQTLCGCSILRAEIKPADLAFASVMADAARTCASIAFECIDRYPVHSTFPKIAVGDLLSCGLELRSNEATPLFFQFERYLCLN